MVSDKYPIGTKVQVSPALDTRGTVGYVIGIEDHEWREGVLDILLSDGSGPWVLVRHYADGYATGYMEDTVMLLEAGNVEHTVVDRRVPCVECDNKAKWDDYLCKDCRR
jgi:hypothetical protein